MLGLSPAEVETLLAMKYALVLRPMVKSIPRIARGEAQASTTASPRASARTRSGVSEQTFSRPWAPERP
jgi:hypothetical protein